MTTPPTMKPPSELEQQLDNFDAAIRGETLQELIASLPEEAGRDPSSPPQVNLHAHTFFSYNPYGYSPSHYAWLARKARLDVAGIVDFDVLDGVDEFHAAGATLNLRTCASIESRVFVPEFADKVINSPGEPGIAYHMGVGFVSSHVPDEATTFLTGMRTSARQRTRTLVEKVNAYLAPLALDFDQDVGTRTPAGNATERHVCEAYVNKAAARYAGDDLHAFWTSKLGDLPEDMDLPEGPKLQGLLRSKTMKRGGAGYVQADGHSFPCMADMNHFSLQCGAIPTLAWLDGTSDGEQEMERLFEVGKSTGVAAINIIPDRNFTAGVTDEKLQNLYDLMALAEKHHFPVIVGTEMNSPGNKFVDDFDSAELGPLVDAFLKGAHIVYAHTVLQRHAGMGYLSDWATSHFAETPEKNAFFRDFGSHFNPGQEKQLTTVTQDTSPEHITALLKG